MSSRSNATSADDPLVGVDLDDAEHLGVERLGSLIAADTDTNEGEALPAGRNDGRRHVVTPRSATARMFAICGISTVSDSRAHDPTAIVAGRSRRPVVSAMASQSRAAK